MHRFARRIATITLVIAASASLARAQDSAAMTVGGATITFGGGLQYLSVDIKFTGVDSSGSFHQQTNICDYGGGLSGAKTPRLAFKTAIA